MPLCEDVHFMLAEEMLYIYEDVLKSFTGHPVYKLPEILDRLYYEDEELWEELMNDTWNLTVFIFQEKRNLSGEELDQVLDVFDALRKSVVY